MIFDIWGYIQLYLVIVVTSIPFIQPLFVDTKAFSWSHYRTQLGRYSYRSQSSSGQGHTDSAGTDDTLHEQHGNAVENLPAIPKDRFVTTTLRDADTESTV